MRHECQMTALRDLDRPGLGQGVGELLESQRRDEQVAVPCQSQCRYAHGRQPAREVGMLDELEAMGHHALVGLPALPGDEIEQRARWLLAAEEEVEELVDEGVVRRQ